MFTHEYIKMHIETKTLLTHAFLRKLVTHQKQPFDRTKEAHVPLKTAVSTRQLTPTVYRPSPSNPPCSAVSSLYQTNASNVLLHVIIYCYTYILIIIITYRIFFVATTMHCSRRCYRHRCKRQFPKMFISMFVVMYLSSVSQC